MALASTTILVVGGRDTCKSSLIDAALVDAARRRDPVHLTHADRQATAVALPMETMAHFWPAYDVRAITTPADFDPVATGLWRRWLRAPPPADAVGDQLAVTIVYRSALPDWLGDNQSSIVIVEVRADLLMAWSNRRPAASAPDRLDLQRLDWLAAAADGVVLCLPMRRPLPAADFAAFQHLVDVMHRSRGDRLRVRVAVTEADYEFSQKLEMSALSLAEIVAPELRRERALELLSRDETKRQLLDGLAGLAAIDLCSSFGLLLMSRSINLDLAHGRSGAATTAHRRATGPLWPLPDAFKFCVPTRPQTIDDWAPIGVFDCIFDAVAS